MTKQSKMSLVVMTLSGAFAALLLAFSLDWLGTTVEVQPLPLVDESFLKTDTWRRSYADLVKADGDIDAFDCYLCHDEDERQKLTFDENKQLVIPEEHEDIVMGHGAHGRNNNCFNCHNDENLLVLQSRDGEELKFEESSQLCGSCHGPTKEDWDAGAHGRISGYWKRDMGPYKREDCVNCHNPHSPRFPGRKPAPAPNHLREPASQTHSSDHGS